MFRPLGGHLQVELRNLSLHHFFAVLFFICIRDPLCIASEIKKGWNTIDSNTRLYPKTQTGNQQKHKNSNKEENTHNTIPPTGGNAATRTSHMYLGHSYEIFIILRTDSTKNCVPSFLTFWRRNYF